FGAVNPLGRVVRIGGHPFKIIGVWQRPTNIFEVPGTPEIAAVVPFESARRSFIIDEWNSLIILVKPKPEVSVSRAMDAATVTLLGGIIGIALGVGVGEVLKRLLAFSTTIPVVPAAIATAASILVGLVFGIAPAARAAKLDPVEALRYE